MIYSVNEKGQTANVSVLSCDRSVFTSATEVLICVGFERPLGATILVRSSPARNRRDRHFSVPHVPARSMTSQTHSNVLPDTRWQRTRPRFETFIRSSLNKLDHISTVEKQLKAATKTTTNQKSSESFCCCCCCLFVLFLEIDRLEMPFVYYYTVCYFTCIFYVALI